VAAYSGASSLSSDFDLDQVRDIRSERAAEILALNDALDCLAKMDTRQVQVVEIRHTDKGRHIMVLLALDCYRY
jgi:hypothetical protein